jgi:hypothetical protein
MQRRILTEPARWVPVDVSADVGVDQGMVVTRRLLCLYGALLGAWETLRRTATEIVEIGLN